MRAEHLRSRRAGEDAVNPVEAAKARWRERALAEARFADRLLDATHDVDGLPMPVADGDDGDEGEHDI